MPDQQNGAPFQEGVPSPGRLLFVAAVLLCLAEPVAAAIRFRPQEISQALHVGYAVRVVDMNADDQPDIVVVDTERVIWFANPNWELHTILDGQTKRDNVCIAPYDIDGDGRLDFALGADWRPFDTRDGGTIQWLRNSGQSDKRWDVLAIGSEPTVHRMQWADLDGDGRSELVVVPLMGRNTEKPDYSQHPIRILAYRVPADPTSGPWQPEVISEQLHVAHNFWPTDLDRDGQTDLVVASFEGVTWLRRRDQSSVGGDRSRGGSAASLGPWQHIRLGEGEQQTSPNRGASEIKTGRLASGRDYVAAIEPWHGHQVVVYVSPRERVVVEEQQAPWPRKLLDDELLWGHGVWCANLDDDADDELVIGVRDTKDADHPCGLRVYDPADPLGTPWRRQFVDPGGVAIEDLTVADLDGDGRNDVVAVGRATHNVRIYWNQGPWSPQGPSPP